MKRGAVDHPRVGIILPAHNEAASVGAVVRSIRIRYPWPVFVVDDCSSDDTVAVAREAGARVLPLTSQLGAWGATQAGFRYLLGHGYQIAATLDADGQHDPGSLPALLNPVLAGEADVAIGTCTHRGSRLRLFAWQLMRGSSGLTVEDITSGFRVYNHSALQVLADRRATLLDYQDVGVLQRLQAEGMRLCDVRVHMHERSAGVSRTFNSWRVIGVYMLHTLILGFAKRRFRNGP